MVTLKDIAKHVGISVTAASLALRDHRSISIETKQKVWSAQEKLGYRRHQRPPEHRLKESSPKAGRGSSNVAFLLVGRQFKDPAYAQYFEAIADTAVASGLRPIYLSAKPEDLRAGMLPPLLKVGEIDGVIVSGLYDEVAHEQLRRLNIPIVVLGNYQLGKEPWAASEIDIAAGMRLMVDRLCELGHRRIGLVTWSTVTESGSQLERAYAASLAKDKAVSGGVATVEGSSVREAILSLLQCPERPSALILTMEGAAVHAYDLCEELGLKIPDDLNIISYGKGEYLLRPSLVTVQDNYEDVGRGAIEKLIRLIEDPKRILTREVFGMRLISGGSISPFSLKEAGLPQEPPAAKKPSRKTAKSSKTL